VGPVCAPPHDAMNLELRHVSARTQRGSGRVTVPIRPNAAVDAADISELRSVCTARISEPFWAENRVEPFFAQHRTRSSS